MKQKNPLLTDPHNLNTLVLPFRDRIKCLFTGWCHNLDELITWEWEQGQIDNESENRAIRREYDVKYRAKKKAELEAAKTGDIILRDPTVINQPAPAEDDLLDLIEAPSLFALNTDHVGIVAIPVKSQFSYTKDGVKYTGDVIVNNPTPEQVREDSKEMEPPHDPDVSDADAAADFDVTGTKVGNERRAMTHEQIEAFTKDLNDVMKQAIDFKPGPSISEELDSSLNPPDETIPAPDQAKED